MSNTKILKLASNLIANNTQYEVVPRRRFERRSVNEPQIIKAELTAENQDMNVQSLDNKHADLLIDEERRQSVRRTSRPTLLSAVEIAKLRKK